MRRFLAGQGGATSIEYAMIAGIVSLAIVSGLTATGASLNAKFFGPLLGGLR